MRFVPQHQGGPPFPLMVVGTYGVCKELDIFRHALQRSLTSLHITKHDEKGLEEEFSFQPLIAITVMSDEFDCYQQFEFVVQAITECGSLLKYEVVAEVPCGFSFEEAAPWLIAEVFSRDSDLQDELRAAFALDGIHGVVTEASNLLVTAVEWKALESTLGHASDNWGEWARAA